MVNAVKKSQVGMGAQFTAEWGRLLTSEKEYRKDLLIKMIFRPEGARHAGGEASRQGDRECTGPECRVFQEHDEAQEVGWGEHWDEMRPGPQRQERVSLHGGLAFILQAKGSL